MAVAKAYGAKRMSRRTLLFVVVAGWALVPDWSGPERLALLGADADIRAACVPLDPRDPGRRRVGRLTFLGGVSLTSSDPAFGGFSALTVTSDRFTLLSDGGGVVRFRLTGAGRVIDARFGDLPAGPKTGWEKRDRDSESMAIDPATGQVWIGFERANAIWRYRPGLAAGDGAVRPAAMADWRSNGGAETLVRRRDGRFIVLAEENERRDAAWRPGLVFAGDPVARRVPSFAFGYVPPPGYDPVDATELPDGRLLVLNRAWSPPLRFASVLTLVDPEAIRPNRLVRGRDVARLASPLISGNFEGIAAVGERGHTVIWLVSDNDKMSFRPTLLLKLQLD